MSRRDQPTFLDRLVFRAVLVFGRLVVLFPAGLTVNLGALAGILASRLMPIRRAVVENNIALALGDSIAHQERRRLTHEAYRHLGMMTAETFYIAFRSLEWVDERVPEVEGWEHIETVQAHRPGFIAFSGHFGNWELLGARAAHLMPIHALSKPLHNPLFQDFINESRSRHGLRFIWTDSSNPIRDIMKTIRKGGIVNILPDQDMRGGGIFVPFFGRPASTTPTPAALALRLDTPLVPVFLVRQGPTRHRLLIRPPIWPKDFAGEDREKTIEAITGRISETIEDMVRLHPAQYFWFHRRWKTTPEKAAKHDAKMKRKRRKRRGLET